MIGIAQLERWLSMRWLHRRATQLLELARNPLLTVYPQPLDIEAEPSPWVTVITPHADDETFGAGGTIARHVDAGHYVTVILFSDNTDSIPDDIADWEDRKLLRSAEFNAAMDVLGVKGRQEMMISVKRMRSDTAMPPLGKLMIGNPHHVLYLPSLFDNHEEHRVINLWVAEELSRRPHVSCIVRAYEVWSPAPANRVADITPVLERKKAAMACYTSQLQMIDYEHHILGLNAWRAMTEPVPVRYAEAFFEAPLSVYLDLVQTYLHT
jgi:LmbE family N-acetylglucosaminyl deacetylase